jgi:RNA polymerase sigma-70 factor (ECF subfamily)
MTDFARLLEAEIPRLRRYARALTRDVSRADDLVQSCLARAVAKQHLWQPGTDLRAWLFTILHNQHVNDVRRAVREGVNVAVEEMAPVLTVSSNAIAALQLRDLEAAIARLPQEQRQVILLVGLEGMRYEEVALILGVPIGTVRSRLSRGRDQLRRLMDMGEDEGRARPATAVAAPTPKRRLGTRRAGKRRRRHAPPPDATRASRHRPYYRHRLPAVGESAARRLARPRDTVAQQGAEKRVVRFCER